MKICDIVQFYSPLGGGVRRYIDDKMRLFARFPELQHVVIIPSDADCVETRFRTTIYHIRSIRFWGSLSYRFLGNRQRILDICREEQPDIIEVGDPYRSAWIALEAGEYLGVPVVSYYHSDFPRALGRTVKRFTGSRIERLLSAPIRRYVINLYNRMSATVVASTRLVNELREDGICNVVRIPLGTDVQEFRPHPYPQPVRDELGLRETDTLILFVGRLAREKNIHSLLQMMEELEARKETQGQCHLLLVGDGELRRLVSSRVQHVSHLTWKQYCQSTTELTRYYTAADVLIHAGCYETFGITSLEAQACGCKVICIQGGGLEDTIAGDHPVIQAESPEPEKLADAVHRYRTTTDSHSAQQRRNRIVEQFSIDMTIRRLIALYRHVISGQPLESFDTDSSSHAQTDSDYPAIPGNGS